jgi:hypothetical protein
MKTIIIIILLLIFSVCQAEEYGSVNYYNQLDSIQNRADFIENLCLLNFNFISTTKKLDCINNECEAYSRITKFIYDFDLVITPWYELLFSIELSNQKKALIENDGFIEIVNKESGQRLKVRTNQVNEIYPLPEAMAIAAKQCVEEVGPILLQEQREISQDFIIDEKSNRNGIIVKYGRLEKLYHSMMIIKYPSEIEKNKIDHIRISIVPSLRLKNDQKFESKSKISKSSILDYPKVSVSIKSSEIQINRLTPENSHLVAFSPTHWIYGVKGIEKGKARLFVNVKNIDSGDLLKSFEYRFTINESFSSRLSSFLVINWQWIASAIIIPLIITIWRKKIIQRLSLKKVNR